MKKILFVLSFSLFLIQKNSANPPISHDIFDILLKKHVNAQGFVNYKGFQRDSSEFNTYLKLLSDNPPDTEKWSKDDQKAYWINAYNAFTIKLILNHYPIESIKDIKRGIPFVNTTWDIKFIKIGNKTYDLNNLEHSILRPKFKDNRIHFAVNCASFSCPKLRNEAYIGEKLNEQLDDQARAFLADKSKNVITANSIKLSKIFTWYSIDFPGNKINYLNKYAPVKINSDADRTSMPYNWALNEQK
jgi:hypothetical protein